MKGQVLDYSIQANEGVITGDDGKRYKFNGAEWKESSNPQRGMNIDFDVSDEGLAIGIYLAIGAKKTLNTSNTSNDYSQQVSTKKKGTYIILTLFLGGLGAHKFYMGSWGWGIVYIVFFFFTFITPLVALVELIRAIMLSDDEFNEKVELFQSKKPNPFNFFW